MKRIVIIILGMVMLFPFIHIQADNSTYNEVCNDSSDIIAIVIEDDIFFTIKVEESNFNRAIKSKLEIDLIINYENSKNKRISLKTNEKGRVDVNKVDNMENINSILISIKRQDRFYFEDRLIRYPEDFNIMENNTYNIKVTDRIINRLITKDEVNLFDRYTIVMRKYFSGNDINDREAWKYLLQDESIINDTNKALSNNNMNLDQYINFLFSRDNATLRKNLWDTYTNRINSGKLNYINMLRSESFRRSSNINLNIYDIKSIDNIYESYITIGSYSMSDLDNLINTNNSLNKWKRQSGKDEGYIFYEKNGYFHTHILSIYPEIYGD